MFPASSRAISISASVPYGLVVGGVSTLSGSGASVVVVVAGGGGGVLSSPRARDAGKASATTATPAATTIRTKRE